MGRIFVHPRPSLLLLGGAADESFTWVDPTVLTANSVTDLEVYLAAAMPPASYIESVLAAGISVQFIDEGATAPYAVADPYGDGYARARAAEAKLAGLYPPECWIVYVLSDENVSTPGSGDPRVTRHAAGIDTGTTRPGWVGYSNRNGIDAARSVAPKMRASWVPRTWGADSSDALVQEIGSPVDGLDLDTIQIADYGQWRPGGTPTSTVKENDMFPRLVTASDATTPWFMTWVHPILGQRVKRVVVHPEADWLLAEGTYNIPGLINNGGPWQWANASIMALPDAPPMPGSIEPAALASAIVAKLPTPGGMTDAQLEADVHAAVISILHGAQ